MSEVPPLSGGPAKQEHRLPPLETLIAGFDWSATPLGPMPLWPQSLKTSVGIVTRSKVPIVMLWGPEGVMIYNDAYSTFAGGRHPRLLGSNVREGWPEVADFNDNVMNVVLAGGALAYRDQQLTLFRHGAPEQVWMDLDYSPILDESGEPAGVIAVVIETTDRVKAERERDEAELRASEVLNGMGDAFVLLDRSFRILSINDAGLRIDHRARREIIGQLHWDAYPGSEHGAIGQAYKSAMRDARPVTLETQYVWPDGQQVWLDIRAYPSAKGLAVFYRDVTERKLAEARLKESEDHYRHAVELDPQTAWTARADGMLDHVGRRWFDWTGTTGLGESWANGLHPDDRQRTFETWAHSVTTLVPYDIVHRVKMLDGAFRWMHSRAYVRKNEAGEVLKWYGKTEDIHERLLAEQDRNEHAKTLEILYRTGANIASELDLERLVQLVTENAVKLTGAAFGTFFYNVVDPVGGSNILVRTSGLDTPTLAQIATPDQASLLEASFSENNILRFDDLAKHSGGADFRRAFGTPPEERQARSYLAVSIRSRSGRLIGGLFLGHEAAYVFHDRHERLAQSIAGQAGVAIDNARLLQEARSEIEARKRVERELAASDAKFRAIADYVDQMIWSTRPDGFHDYFNQRWYDFTGTPAGSTDGDGWNGLFHPDDQDRAWAAWRHSLATGEPYHIEYRLRHHTGQYRWVLGRAQPVQTHDRQIERWYGTCTDIQDIVEAREVLARSRVDLERLVAERTSELEKVQETLRQAQKMEAVGQLTGGIAHDFNNMLAVVIGSLDLLGRRLSPTEDRLRRYVDAASDGARRAALLTQRLLAFSRQQPLKPTSVEANRLVSGMSELLGRSLGVGISLETVLAAGLWRTHTDPNQLENVIINLAVNARDAMPDGGRLTIETQNAYLDARYAQAHPGTPEGQYVLIAVTDTGAGMSADVLARAFDPFFTTKDVGKGTGLGLSQVYGFVRQSGGHVKIYSEASIGTTVKIYLPRRAGEIEDAAPQAMRLPTPLGDAQELILVVEDEPGVRQFSVAALEELGYAVLQAENAVAALRLLDAHPDVSLLFTDVVMPEINGRKLADEARRRRPGLKVLFTTGYTRNAVVHNGILDAGVRLIGKPFTVEELAERVREALDGA